MTIRNTFSGTFIVVVGTISISNVVGSEELKIEELKQAIAHSDLEVLDWALPWPDHSANKAIDGLAEIGTLEALEVLEKILTTSKGHRRLKQHALLALGRLGKRPALDVIRVFEAWTEKRRSRPLPFFLGKIDHASDHFGPHQLEPLRTVSDERGTEWVIFIWPRLGRYDLWLTSRREGEEWTKPVLLDIPLKQRSSKVFFSTSENGDRFLLTIDGQTHRFTTKEKARDRDGDGLTDLYECRITTDPLKPDTDRDGTPDGEDGNPLTAPQKKHDDLSAIRQAVFTMMFATSSSWDPILLVQNGPYADQEYEGYLGPVLRTPVSRVAGTNVEEMTITWKSPTQVAVRVRDSVGEHSSGEFMLDLKKIHDKWVVIKYQVTET